jgi:adenylate cyclase
MTTLAGAPNLHQVMHRVLRFDRFALDLTRGCLYAGEQDIELPPKPFEVLRYLAANAGRLVPKQELYEAVWPNVSVSDDSLVQCVRELRQKLGDEEHRLVKTVHRRGYLFDVSVSVSDGTAVATLQANTASAAVEPPSLVLPLPDRPSVAVLPFTNLSGDREQEYFADGIVDDIITELSRFSELFVIARNSSFQYKGSAIDVRQVARDLGVRYLLEGSVRRGGDRIRIAAQLIDAVTGGHIWAERYDREVQDIFAVQDEAVRTIVAILAAHVKRAETKRTLSKPPRTWLAYDYYLQAVASFASYMSSFSAKELYETRRLLEHSLSIDPNYARSYAMLANTHATAWITPLDEDFLRDAARERAYALACKAVQLDPNLPQAHACLGLVLNFKHKHEAAIAEFEKAIALNPNFSDFRFGLALVYAGNPKRAVEVLQAYMRLDPFYAPLTSGYLGFAHYMLKQYSEALPVLQEHVTRAPGHRSGHVWLAATHAQLSQFEEARAAAAEVLRLQPDYTIDATQAKIGKFKYDEDEAHFFDWLRKAGLPEN